MILACQNINKAFGTDVILKNASFHMEDREKAAVVGINGAGKSTLLKIIIRGNGSRLRRGGSGKRQNHRLSGTASGC